MSDADMHHYCRQLATSCFSPALHRNVEEAWDQPGSPQVLFPFCADKHVSIGEQHNKTHQARHLQGHVTLTHHDKLLLQFALLSTLQ